MQQPVMRSALDELTGRKTTNQVDRKPDSGSMLSGFTDIREMETKPGRHVLRVVLDSGQHLLVATDLCKEEAVKRELAIHQIMIEYRTKRNAWEKDLVQSKDETLSQA